jgi:hypothetical protein
MHEHELSVTMLNADSNGIVPLPLSTDPTALTDPNEWLNLTRGSLNGIVMRTSYGVFVA